MSKQFTFCANKEDDVWMLEIIKEIFPNPYFIANELRFENYPLDNLDINPTLFTDKKYINYLEYFDYRDFNNNFEKVLDKFESPVIEYSASLMSNNSYGFGRFYCAYSSNKEFSQEVSKLFRKLKKQFHYFKEHKLYVSKTIDLEKAYFYLDNKEVQLTL